MASEENFHPGNVEISAVLIFENFEFFSLLNYIEI